MMYICFLRFPGIMGAGMLLGAGSRLISSAEKELITGSNCSGKQRQGVI